ncbi:MAG: S8 family serine peptidase [Bacteroidota bacterium]
MDQWLSILWTFLLSGTAFWHSPEPPASIPFETTSQLYLVSFTEKKQTTFCPETELDHKAIVRRQRNGLPEWDWFDLPVTPGYIESIDKQVDTLRHILRWFNAVSVKARPYQLANIARLPFVKEIKPLYGQAILSQKGLSGPDEQNQRLDTLLSLVRNLMHLDSLEKAGLTGQGVRIAIFDAGFKDTDVHPSLTHVRSRNGIVGTKDFYDGDDNVYHHSTHGMRVMSCIGGIYQGRQLGAARDAEFLLARIEHERKELRVEEDHWMAAAEWADRMGADIINSSVTYTSARYTIEQMDGLTTPVSKAAKIATDKGMLVVVSMGNDGDKSWRFMGAPADVPQVLSVGGSLPMLQQHIRFASVGPNARGLLKPDVAAPGFVLSAIRKDKFGEIAGTSFSSPLIAGIAACLLQKQPNRSNRDLFHDVRELGHFYPYYDYELGYGVPDMRKLSVADSSFVPDTLFSVKFTIDSVFVLFDSLKLRQDTSRFPNGRLFYYHLERTPGLLSTYHETRLPSASLRYAIPKSPGARGTFRIWMEGYLFEQKLY